MLLPNVMVLWLPHPSYVFSIYPLDMSKSTSGLTSRVCSSRRSRFLPPTPIHSQPMPALL